MLAAGKGWVLAVLAMLAPKRIGGIAVEHLDRHRTAVGGTQQADHPLRTIAAMIAAVAVLRQFAAPPFQVRGGDVVGQQGTIREMATG